MKKQDRELFKTEEELQSEAELKEAGHYLKETFITALRTNAAVLVCGFMVLVRGVHHAWKKWVRRN
jgi:hypothetical protein